MKPSDTSVSRRDRFLQLVRERAYREGHFVLSSGRTSSFYVNGKMVTLHPEGLALASRLILDALQPDVRAVGGLTIGADPIVGGVVALLYAPQDGRKTRQKLMELGDDARETMGRVPHAMREAERAAVATFSETLKKG